ncbi:hypothetical protein [Saccharopolyspora dendranthemae]|uniref:Uncharacterized protein n=1 Tax=Saccharopolyspora dendranthemae TaxID=1181886 RepID=A0A561U224_9PSEU|nr:hypothetical protein [Saccharopolyspora dendranthemae]TWF93419.1 hypothetical protein FHU35_15263 [Saccharopolyspora dendranthemae]
MITRMPVKTVRDYLDGTITPQTLVEQMSTNEHMVDLFSGVTKFINTEHTDEEPPQPTEARPSNTPKWEEDDGDFSDETWLQDGLTYDD